MKKDKAYKMLPQGVKITVSPIFLAVFICSLFSFTLTPAAAEDIFTKREKQAGAAGNEEAVKKVIKRPQMEYSSAQAKDPFESPFAKGEGSSSVSGNNKPPALTVQGMIWGGDFSQAIINNRVLKVGDKIEGAEIIAIEKKGVTLSFNDSLFTLSPESETKKPINQGGQR